MEVTKEIISKMSGMMQHYFQMKEKYNDCIIFYRLGDFYEMFFDDAVLVSKLLELTLTGRDCGLDERAPMCGIPYHAVDTYINKLVKLGYKIAICEQLSEAIKGKKVDRDVVRVITSGTITNNLLLDEKKNNYILCVAKTKNKLGASYADITTGEFYTVEFNENLISELGDLLVRINPAEIICNADAKFIFDNLPANITLDLPKVNLYYDWAFDEVRAIGNLKKQFGETCLQIYEINEYESAIIACGALMEYLNETQKILLAQINKIQKIKTNDFLILDATARRNLELCESMRERKKRGTVLAVIDQTQTSMGARKLRNWLDQPLVNDKEINERLDAVEEIYKNLILRDNFSRELKQIQDIERISSKVGMKTIMPKECITLKESLKKIPDIRYLLSSCKSTKLQNLYNKIEDISQISNLIEQTISENPASHLKDGEYIAKGKSSELDYLRDITKNGATKVTDMQTTEREKTGIKNLRIRFNNVYGYFIEVSRELASSVPENYHRKQTVGNFDRYFTNELKELELTISTAEEKSIKLEQEIYNEFRNILIEFLPILQTTSQIISELDCIVSLANVAIKNNFVKPNINKNIKNINIVNGRHPVVEQFLTKDEFISNDTFLDEKDDRIMIITGPNMAGKSTYMRQVAIITLLAHIGSFVPAEKADICITDRIFTRVGASDDLASGQSTFMVEMTEMAGILHNATDKSLIILDEIGRGTSTFDGLSIAWAILEHFSQNTKSKVLFATHYHELTELEGLLTGVKNYRISVKEINNSIVFLRKIVRGGANRSFGIEVASLAGIPNDIIARAKEISHSIDQNNFNIKLGASEVEKSEELQEINSYNNQIVGIIKDIDINKMTPLGAFEILQDLIGKVR